MLLKVPTKEEIAQARHELDIEDAETRGKIELIDELEKYMKKITALWKWLIRR